MAFIWWQLEFRRGSLGGLGRITMVMASDFYQSYRALTTEEVSEISETLHPQGSCILQGRLAASLHLSASETPSKMYFPMTPVGPKDYPCWLLGPGTIMVGYLEPQSSIQGLLVQSVPSSRTT